MSSGPSADSNATQGQRPHVIKIGGWRRGILIVAMGGMTDHVQLTSVWLDSAALAKTTSDSIKSNVQRTASGLLPQAVEKTITINARS